MVEFMVFGEPGVRRQPAPEETRLERVEEKWTRFSARDPL
jgi:hypothetical protein